MPLDNQENYVYVAALLAALQQKIAARKAEISNYHDQKTKFITRRTELQLRIMEKRQQLIQLELLALQLLEETQQLRLFPSLAHELQAFTQKILNDQISAQDIATFLSPNTGLAARMQNIAPIPQLPALEGEIKTLRLRLIKMLRALATKFAAKTLKTKLTKEEENDLKETAKQLQERLDTEIDLNTARQEIYDLENEIATNHNLIEQYTGAIIKLELDLQALENADLKILQARKENLEQDLVDQVAEKLELLSTTRNKERAQQEVALKKQLQMDLGTILLSLELEYQRLLAEHAREKYFVVALEVAKERIIKDEQIVKILRKAATRIIAKRCIEQITEQEIENTYTNLSDYRRGKLVLQNPKATQLKHVYNVAERIFNAYVMNKYPGFNLGEARRQLLENYNEHHMSALRSEIKKQAHIIAARKDFFDLDHLPAEMQQEILESTVALIDQLVESNLDAYEEFSTPSPKPSLSV
jgi:hypothetical protein